MFLIIIHRILRMFYVLKIFMLQAFGILWHRLLCHSLQRSKLFSTMNKLYTSVPMQRTNLTLESVTTQSTLHSYSSVHKKFSFIHYSPLSLSFRSQTLHRVCYCRFYRLKTYCQQCNTHCDNSC